MASLCGITIHRNPQQLPQADAPSGKPGTRDNACENVTPLVFSYFCSPPTFSHLPSSLTWKTLPSQCPGRAPVNEDSGNERRQHSGRREGTRMGGRHLCVCLYVILLGVSGVAELSGPDPKMNDNGEGDDVWVELLPVQLVDTHRARFLEGRKSQRSES